MKNGAQTGAGDGGEFPKKAGLARHSYHLGRNETTARYGAAEKYYKSQQNEGTRLRVELGKVRLGRTGLGLVEVYENAD